MLVRDNSAEGDATKGWFPTGSLRIRKVNNDEIFLSFRKKYSKTPFYRGFWGQAKTRGKSQSAVNRGSGFWKLAKKGGKGL